MAIARLWYVAAALLCLTACGGGGGGSDNRPPLSISFSTSAVAFQAESVFSRLPPSQTITATLAGTPPVNSTLFILVEIGNPAIVSVTNVGPTSGSNGQATIVPGDPSDLGMGEHSTTIVVHTCFNSPTCSNGEIAGSPKTITVTYSVPSSVRGDNVSPNVVPANAPGEVILRGRNFRANTAVTIGGTAATSTFVSSSELRVQYPARAAGRYPILLDSGAVAFTGELIVTDIPAFAGATLPFPGLDGPFTGVQARSILYDAQRRAIIVQYVPFGDNMPIELTRFTYDAGTWTQGPVVPFNIGARQIALNPDGSRVLMLVQRRIGFGDTDRMLELDPQTLQEIASTPLLQLSQHGTARSFAILNDGNALISAEFPGSGIANLHLYALTTHTLVDTGFGSDLPLVGSSDDGSVAFEHELLLMFDSSTERFTRAPAQISGLFHNQDWGNNPLPPSLCRNGSKALLGYSVLSRQGQLLGTLPFPPVQNTGVINKQCTRVYAIDETNLLHTFDITAAPVNGKYQEIGAPVALPNTPTDLGAAGRIAVAPDDRTLFILSQHGVRVQPAPQ